MRNGYQPDMDVLPVLNDNQEIIIITLMGLWGGMYSLVVS